MEICGGGQTDIDFYLHISMLYNNWCEGTIGPRRQFPEGIFFGSRLRKEEVP